MNCQRTQVLSGVDELSENTSVVSRWIVREHKCCQERWTVREHKCCQEWIECQRTQVLSGQRMQVLSEVDELWESASVVRSGWIVRECKCQGWWIVRELKCCSESMDCLSGQMSAGMDGMSDSTYVRNGWMDCLRRLVLSKVAIWRDCSDENEKVFFLELCSYLGSVSPCQCLEAFFIWSTIPFKDFSGLVHLLLVMALLSITFLEFWFHG